MPSNGRSQTNAAVPEARCLCSGWPRAADKHGYTVVVVGNGPSSSGCTEKR